MIKGILILILAVICTGCASSQANASSSVNVQSIEKSTHSRPIKGSFKECRMMTNGYLVCPKTYQN